MTTTENKVFELVIESGCWKEYVILGKHEDCAYDVPCTLISSATADEFNPFYTQTVLKKDSGELRINGWYRITEKQAFADVLSRVKDITARCNSRIRTARHAEEHLDCPNNENELK